MKIKRVKELINELDNLEGNKNLDSIYQCLVEIDYLLYKYKNENEYIDKIIHNITRFYWESNYLKQQYIFNLIKASCNVLNRYIIGRRGGVKSAFFLGLYCICLSALRANNI